MCEPTTLMIAAAAVSTISTVFSGIQQSQMHKYEAGVAKNNALYADRQAEDAIERGKQEQLNHARKVAALRSEQQAAFAAEGLDLGFGSALDVAGDTTVMGLADQATIRENHEREAQGYRISAQNYRAKAAASKAASRNALISTALDTAATVLSSASQVGSTMSTYGKPTWMGGSGASWTPKTSSPSTVGGFSFGTPGV